MLSGYLITDLLLQEYEETETIAIGPFYQRRFKCLYPAMLATFFVTAIYMALFQSNMLNNLRMTFISSVFSFNNWWQIAKGGSYFAHLMAEAPFQHIYSLAIEAQFYLVWPILVLMLQKTVKDRFMIYLTLAGLVFLSVIEMAVLFNGKDPTRIYYGTDTRLFSVLMGGKPSLYLA